ncbi:hypothetical protein ANCCAN_04746 [Ancylostoma caninum]|uniref:Uncharacterized protein n=1 Tax=Ancylostoma caninum TaxID=29170 RepID=A0A368GXT9_ANCCA|nr:hypothetical protein ANCCAN_04746 [Ancylostoma caninum]
MKLLISGLLLLVVALQVEPRPDHRRVKRGQHRIGTPIDFGTIEVEPTVITKRIELQANPVVHKYTVNYGGDLGDIDLSKYQLGGVKVIQGEPIVRKYTMRQVNLVPGMEQEVFNVVVSLWYISPENIIFSLV